MLNAQQVWNRIHKLKAFSSLNEFDFRPVYFNQIIQAAAATTTAYAAQEFPNGAVILGITSSAYLTGVGIAGQSNANRQLYGLDFQFSNTDAITIGGPVMADALLGGGDIDGFPVREIIIPPGSKINCRAQNWTTVNLVVHVVYAALVYRTNA